MELSSTSIAPRVVMDTMAPCRRSSSLERSPVRIAGPCVSSRMGMGNFTFLLSVLMCWMTLAWESWSPWDMFSRAMLMPASYSFCNIS